MLLFLSIMSTTLESQNNGKNIITFDGDSTIYNKEGEVVERAAPWYQGITANDYKVVNPRISEVESQYFAILQGLEHFDSLRDEETKWLVGVSGGVDSSVVACLLERAFGPERVFGINMPTRFNSETTKENARLLCAHLDIDYVNRPIDVIHDVVARNVEYVEFPSDLPGEYDTINDENVQARIRSADILAGVAYKFGMLFTSNGNKTETALGYATLYGDISGAVAPIGDLYKPQVFELARFLNDEIYGEYIIPENLLDGSTVPSAELSDEQNVDEGKGDPIKYGYHDAVLRQLIEYRKNVVDFYEWYLDGTLLQEIGWGTEAEFNRYFEHPQDFVDDLDWITMRLRTCYFKRLQAPPIIVLSKRSFGFDLRETMLPPYNLRGYEALKDEIIHRPDQPLQDWNPLWK